MTQCVFWFLYKLKPKQSKEYELGTFPPYPLLAHQQYRGSCGTRAARPGTQWWGMPYKEDYPNVVGPAELSHGGLEPSPTVKLASSLVVTAAAPTNLQISTDTP